MKTKTKHTLTRVWRALIWTAASATLVLAALAAAGWSRDSVAGCIARTMPLVWIAVAAPGIAANRSGENR